jgi:hypothetical protein
MLKCSTCPAVLIACGDTAQEKLWPTLRANWALWPLANWIAFRYLSGDMRILYANIIGVRHTR